RRHTRFSRDWSSDVCSSDLGESGGDVRNVASPDIYTEDFSAAVDYVGLLPSVDRDRIGAIGICGLSGMALTAATSDTRIKAVARSEERRVGIERMQRMDPTL